MKKLSSIVNENTKSASGSLYHRVLFLCRLQEAKHISYYRLRCVQVNVSSFIRQFTLGNCCTKNNVYTQITVQRRKTKNIFECIPWHYPPLKQTTNRRRRRRKRQEPNHQTTQHSICMRWELLHPDGIDIIHEVNVNLLNLLNFYLLSGCVRAHTEHTSSIVLSFTVSLILIIVMDANVTFSLYCCSIVGAKIITIIAIATVAAIV